jgi:metal transporter CNNM
MDTCTDIIEEIISEEIVDETDQYEDNQSKRRAKRMTTAAVMRGCVFSLSYIQIVTDGCSIVERERRTDPANPNSDERMPLLGVSPGLLEAGDLAARGIGYGGIRFGSPRS